MEGVLSEGVLSEGFLSEGVLSGGGFVRAPERGQGRGGGERGRREGHTDKFVLHSKLWSLWRRQSGPSVSTLGV